MSMQNRIESLKVKHANLEDVLASKNSLPNTSDAEMAELKRQKLAIKDELASISTH